MHLGEAIQGWFKYVANHYAKTTCANYKYQLYLLADYLPNNIEIKNVNIETLENFIHQLNVSRSSKNSAIIALKSFYRYCVDFYDIPNTAAKIKKFKVIHRQRFLTEEEYQKILAVCRPKERAIVEFLSNSGLRCSAFLALDKSNIQGSMLYVACKGRARIVPLNETAKKSLSNLLNGNMNISKSINLGRTGVYSVCCRLAKKAKLDERFGPHSLRRLFANRLRRHKIDIFLISKILGHASIKTTQIYFGLDGMELAGVTDFLDRDPP